MARVPYTQKQKKEMIEYLSSLVEKSGSDLTSDERYPLFSEIARRIIYGELERVSMIEEKERELWEKALHYNGKDIKKAYRLLGMSLRLRNKRKKIYKELLKDTEVLFRFIPEEELSHYPFNRLNQDYFNIIIIDRLQDMLKKLKE